MNKLIVVDGIDGVGKTTVAKLLAEKMGGEYYKTPPEEYSQIREIFDSGEATAKYLFYLATLIHSSSLIWEKLEKKSVIIDRFIPSTICYHEVQGVNTDIVEWRNLPVLKPDFYFCLEVTKREEWQRRIAQREGKSMACKINSDYARFNSINTQIKKLILSLDGTVIDTTNSSVEETVNKILLIIKRGDK